MLSWRVAAVVPQGEMQDDFYSWQLIPVFQQYTANN